MTQHIWKARGLTNTTVFRGIGAYREARTRQGDRALLPDGTSYLDYPTDGWRYRLAFAFAGYFLERYRQSGSIAAWALWDSAEKYGHRYARGGNAASYEAVGRRVLYAALAMEWRVVYAVPPFAPDKDGRRYSRFQTPLLREPLLGALLGAFEEAGAWQPLRDYLEEKRYERMINFFETGHPERVPSPGPLGNGTFYWPDGNPPS